MGKRQCMTSMEDSVFSFRNSILKLSLLNLQILSIQAFLYLRNLKDLIIIFERKYSHCKKIKYKTPSSLSQGNHTWTIFP